MNDARPTIVETPDMFVKVSMAWGGPALGDLNITKSGQTVNKTLVENLLAPGGRLESQNTPGAWAEFTNEDQRTDAQFEFTDPEQLKFFAGTGQVVIEGTAEADQRGGVITGGNVDTAQRTTALMGAGIRYEYVCAWLSVTKTVTPSTAGAAVPDWSFTFKVDPAPADGSPATVTVSKAAPEATFMGLIPGGRYTVSEVGVQGNYVSGPIKCEDSGTATATTKGGTTVKCTADNVFTVPPPTTAPPTPTPSCVTPPGGVIPPGATTPPGGWCPVPTPPCVTPPGGVIPPGATTPPGGWCPVPTPPCVTPPGGVIPPGATTPPGGWCPVTPCVTPPGGVIPPGATTPPGGWCPVTPCVTPPPGVTPSPGSTPPGGGTWCPVPPPTCLPVGSDGVTNCAIVPLSVKAAKASTKVPRGKWLTVVTSAKTTSVGKISTSVSCMKSGGSAASGCSHRHYSGNKLRVKVTGCKATSLKVRIVANPKDAYVNSYSANSWTRTWHIKGC